MLCPDCGHLFSNQSVTLEQFNVQNQRIQTEQALAKRRAELDSILETQKDTEENSVPIKNKLYPLHNLTLMMSIFLRSCFHQVIHKIEVHQDGFIKIHYNIATLREWAIITGDLIRSPFPFK